MVAVLAPVDVVLGAAARRVVRVAIVEAAVVDAVAVVHVAAVAALGRERPDHADVEQHEVVVDKLEAEILDQAHSAL